MTTTVTVKTHSWEVDVVTTSLSMDNRYSSTSKVDRVAKDSTRDFTIYDGQYITFHEIKNGPET